MTPLPKVASTLLVLPRDKSREMWDGPRTGPERAPSLLAVDSADTLHQLAEVVSAAASMASHVYYDGTSPIHRKHHEIITKAVGTVRGAQMLS